MEMCRLDILTSGLNVIQSTFDVTDFDIQTQNYTMSSSQSKELNKVMMRSEYCQMGLEVVIDLTVLYRMWVYSNNFKEIGVNYMDKIVRPVTRTRIRDNAVYYDAVALYSTKRVEFQDRF
jgi:hypothetical protein